MSDPAVELDADLSDEGEADPDEPPPASEARNAAALASLSTLERAAMLARHAGPARSWAAIAAELHESPAVVRKASNAANAAGWLGPV